MNGDVIMAIINTLNQVEVKGFQNMDKIIGVINVLSDELKRLEGEADGKK